jgi:hypothetical protein
MEKPMSVSPIAAPAVQQPIQSASNRIGSNQSQFAAGLARAAAEAQHSAVMVVKPLSATASINA